MFRLDLYYEYLGDEGLVCLGGHGCRGLEASSTCADQWWMVGSALSNTPFCDRWYSTRRWVLMRARHTICPKGIGMRLGTIMLSVSTTISIDSTSRWYCRLTNTVDEGEYNRDVAARSDTMLCLDRANFAPSGETPIEPCDLYYVADGEAVFGHIKRWRSSGEFSHLINQGVNAIRLFEG